MPHSRSKTNSKSKKNQPQTTASARKLRQLSRQPFRLGKRIKHPVKLPSAWSIFKKSVSHLWLHKKLFGMISLIYLVLTVLLVRGFGFTADLGVAKEAVQELVSGFGGQIAVSLTLVGVLVGAGSPASDVAALYQAVVFILVSLVIIWALRQTHAREKITTKDAFYKSTYPLVPFVLVILVLGLQLLPFAIGNFIYAIVVSNGIAVAAAGKLLAAILVFVLSCVSIYMLCASIFALYIVTLPDMTPFKALRSAKGLVRYRRWAVIRKVLFLPFILGILFVVIMLPVVLLLTPVAEMLFLVLSAISLPIAHSYMYSLYRELL